MRRNAHICRSRSNLSLVPSQQTNKPTKPTTTRNMNPNPNNLNASNPASMTPSTPQQEAFARCFDAPATHYAWAPGRVNLIGEHTDYNEGFVLPCAISFATHALARQRSDRQLRVVAERYRSDGVLSFSLDDLAAPAKGWGQYVRGVLGAVQADYPMPFGLDVWVDGDVPLGAGLSSSAALEVALLALLRGVYGWSMSQHELAHRAQRAENEFVGAQCGIMDMWVSAHAQAGCATLLDCRSLHETPVPVPPSLRLLIIHSRVQRGLVTSEYNQRRSQCTAAAHALGHTSLRDASLSELTSTKLEDVLLRRARHIVSENQRTLDMATAMQRNDISAISTLMAASHASMRDDFAITHPSIDHIVQLLAPILGERGGVRMTGGGFGGCCVALTPPDLLDTCLATLQQHYRSPEGEPALTWQPDIMGGAGYVKLG